jgi:type III secretion system YseE family protein
MMEKKERLTLTEMERELLNDHDGSYRQELLKQLVKYQQFIISHMSDGLDPHLFDVFNKLKQALESAEKIITNFK